MLSTGIGGMILRPLCRGVVAAAVPVVIPAVATYAGGYVAECALARAGAAISGCFNRVRGHIKLTVPAGGVYIVVDGVPHEIDCAKKYEIVGGKLREIPDDADENWTVI